MIRFETLGFYEAELVKTRREDSFLLIFGSFCPTCANKPPAWLLVLDRVVRGTSAAMIKHQKPVTLLSAQRS
jgi:hypothetical protein